MTSRNHKIRLALLISGGGTTMASIIKACREGMLPKVEPVLVIASTPEAGGIKKARELGIPKKDILILNPKKFKDRKEFGLAILKGCKKRKVNFIGQYGWMVLTPKNVVRAFKGKIVNQHPGPLDTKRPDFGGKGMYGVRVLKARLEFSKRVKRDFWTEATCHSVTEEFDKGRVMKREKMEFSPRDTARKIQKRLLPIEHKVQIACLKDFSEGKAKPFKRKIPLVRRGEEGILEKCKQIAINTYPNG